MAIPVFSNDTRTTWQISPVTDSNSAVPGTLISLEGATGAVVRFLPENLPAFTGTGTATIGSTTVNYKPSVADLAIPGPTEVQVSVQFTDGTLLPLQPLKFALYPAI